MSGTLRFLSTSIGVRYLHEIEFIEREIEQWFHVGAAASFGTRAC